MRINPHLFLLDTMFLLEPDALSANGLINMINYNSNSMVYSSTVRKYDLVENNTSSQMCVKVGSASQQKVNNGLKSTIIGSFSTKFSSTVFHPLKQTKDINTKTFCEPIGFIIRNFTSVHIHNSFEQLVKQEDSFIESENQLDLHNLPIELYVSNSTAASKGKTTKATMT